MYHLSREIEGESVIVKSFDNLKAAIDYWAEKNSAECTLELNSPKGILITDQGFITRVGEKELEGLLL